MVKRPGAPRHSLRRRGAFPALPSARRRHVFCSIERRATSWRAWESGVGKEATVAGNSERGSLHSVVAGAQWLVVAPLAAHCLAARAAARRSVLVLATGRRCRVAPCLVNRGVTRTRFTRAVGAAGGQPFHQDAGLARALTATGAAELGDSLCDVRRGTGRQRAWFFRNG